MATYEQMYPHTEPIENKIKLLLTMRGYKTSDIHFRTTGGTNTRHLRYGYWKPLDLQDVLYVNEVEKEIYLEEFHIYDEDCGWKFGYEIKNNSNHEVTNAKETSSKNDIV